MLRSNFTRLASREDSHDSFTSSLSVSSDTGQFLSAEYDVSAASAGQFRIMVQSAEAQIRDAIYAYSPHTIRLQDILESPEFSETFEQTG